MMKLKYRSIIILSCTLLLLMGCEDSWLDTKPKSFFAPDNAFETAEGMDAALLPARKALRDNDWGSDCFIRTEYYWTDISYGSLQNAGFPRDAILSLTPFNDAFQSWTRKYWENSYKVIKDMNLVINRIDIPEYENEAQRNALLSEAYFHRAYWYYRLVHRFGDVPFAGAEITQPRLDYYSHSREVILNRIKEDMEYAGQWLPEKAAGGKVGRGAGNHLLAKICLSVGDFDGAIAAASKVINSDHALVTDRFGSALFSDDPAYDHMWDLHQSQNMVSSSNPEALLVAIDEYETQGNSGGSNANRYWIPLWWLMPDCEYNMSNGEDDMEAALGRAVSWARPNNFFNYTMKAEDPNDLRYSEKNWWGLEDYYYNKPGTSRFGQQIDINDQGIDSISRMFEFPFYKVNAPRTSPAGTTHQGGYTNFYVYRLAETYLLRAEAYWWKGDLANAAADVNVVRARANASQKTPADITIDYIMNERARELYTEEARWSELARVSYTMALLGRDGYSLDNMHEKNYYYDKIMRTDDIFQREVLYKDQVYRVAPYHVYWPVPQNAIDANALGHINQNKGYTGSDSNIPPKTEITEED